MRRLGISRRMAEIRLHMSIILTIAYLVWSLFGLAPLLCRMLKRVPSSRCSSSWQQVIMRTR